MAEALESAKNVTVIIIITTTTTIKSSNNPAIVVNMGADQTIITKPNLSTSTMNR